MVLHFGNGIARTYKCTLRYPFTVWLSYGLGPARTISRVGLTRPCEVRTTDMQARKGTRTVPVGQSTGSLRAQIHRKTVSKHCVCLIILLSVTGYTVLVYVKNCAGMHGITFDYPRVFRGLTVTGSVNCPGVSCDRGNKVVCSFGK